MSTYYSCLILNEKPFFEVTNWVSEFATLDSIFTFPHSTSTIYLMVLSRVANLGPNLHIFFGSGFKTCYGHGYKKKIKSGSGLNIKSKLGQILNWVFFLDVRIQCQIFRPGSGLIILQNRTLPPSPSLSHSQ